MINCSPYTIAVMFAWFAKMICLLCAPLADLSMPIWEVYKQVFIGNNVTGNIFAFDLNSFSFIKSDLIAFSYRICQ